MGATPALGNVARRFALPRKLAEHRQAAVPTAREAYLGEDGAVEVAREELRARVRAGEAVVLEWRLSGLPVEAGAPA